MSERAQRRHPDPPGEDQALTPDQVELADWIGEQMALVFAREKGLPFPTETAEVDFVEKERGMP